MIESEPAPPFLLAYTPTIEDYERLHRLRQGPRRVWLLRLTPPFAIAVGLIALATGDPAIGVVLIACGVVLAFGAALLWWLRTRRIFEANPTALTPLHEVVDEQGMTVTTDTGLSSTVPWAHWGVALLTSDRIVLLASDSPLASGGWLPRRGLAEPHRWNELVLFVAARVPVHPRSPIKPWVYQGSA